MNAHSIQKTERQYFIDWLRILLIFSVFLYHIGMFFNTWDWHVNNPTRYGGGLTYTMIFLSKWRMPLLFVISGAGTYYALGKRSPLKYLGERYKRLVIPLTAGIFILVPVQVYLERAGQYSSLLTYYPHMFEGIYPEGNFSWHHLWFIAYLFIISLIISPFLNLFRTKGCQRFSTWLEGFAARPLSLNLVAVILIGSQLLFKPHFPQYTHALVGDWAAIVFYLIFFLAGFLLLSNKNIIESIRKQKNLYLIEGGIATAMMFSSSHLFANESVVHLVWNISATVLAWSCGLAAIGYARQYLNHDSPLRKLANEAIYPFYLLHQPVILILGFFLIKVEMPDFLRFLILTISSFGISSVLYWYLVRPFNLTRVIFGMKPLSRSRKQAIVPKDSELKHILAINHK